MNNQRTSKWEYSLWAIIVVICCIAPLLAYASYDEGRHYDHFMGGVVVFMILFYGAATIAVIAVFAFAVRRSIKNRKIYVYLTLAIALTLGASFGAYRVGKYAWRNELAENERIAQNVVTLLDAYKTEHGAYPDSLDQLGKGGVVMQRGTFKEELQYEKSNGHFSLSISCGWYERVYDSKADKWGWID